MIVRNVHPLMMDREILKRRDLTPASKLVFAYYCDRQGRGDESYTETIPKLCGDVGLSYPQFMRAVRLLQKARLLVIGEECLGAHVPTNGQVVERVVGATK